MSCQDDFPKAHTPSCSRRLFLVGTATTFAGAVLAACGGKETPASVEAEDVPVGSAVVVGNFIIAQPTSGVFHAYSTVCPHQGAKVEVVEGDTVRCPKHNSVFSIEDGSVVEGPARAPLDPAKLSAAGTTLTAS
ncbi:Rieske (2Fe-2S) protein [Corynebacterium sp. P5875]|uniref:Rieske (2Fe-2S) protein n=1 Tax=Corynebacterium antarcticum TaxID=2800405 RepID=A0A9Q4CBI9_9CORY|nr:Rieske (2Fe-2S) protein [Corynebacterium sp. TAE3-ERU16]MBV7293792.1 Rieske (2Fe-2S) protein [Corynebacterium sp. TAE3-ERU16]MCX7537779.1 Rieske (2Fe-2S) protein [Corynebacterium antarcticum]